MVHTKEPWNIDPNHNRDIQADECEIATALADYQQGEELCIGGKITATVEEACANAHRIVACVNALAGYNPDAVADVVAALEAVVNFETGAWGDAKCALTRLRSIDNA